MSPNVTTVRNFELRFTRLMCLKTGIQFWNAQLIGMGVEAQGPSVAWCLAALSVHCPQLADEINLAGKN